jgi:hypothetical protein
MAHIPGTKGYGHKIDEAFCFWNTYHFFTDRIEKPEIIIDSPGLVRKPHFKTLNHGILSAGKVKELVADANVFKSKRVHLKEGQVVGNTEPFVDTPQRSAGAELPDVMDPGAEAVTSTVKAVAQSSGVGMPFQNEYPFTGPCKGQGSCKTPCSGADDYRIGVEQAVSETFIIFIASIPMFFIILLCRSISN